MPLIIISGLPSSGKSYRAEQLREYFSKDRGKVVKVISENSAVPRAGYAKNEYFADSQKEKIVRSDLKSDVIRHLNKDDVVVFDAGNYIKGYRYEVYCATKSARVSQCTVFCAINEKEMKEFNGRRTGADEVGLDNGTVPYDDHTLDALKMRFEEPQGNNRWDAPLFTIFPESQLDFESIYTSLYEKGPPPPNLSTQNAPLSATNYLFELDKMTQSINQQILQAQKDKSPLKVGGLEAIPSANLVKFTPILLNRLRRQFLNYTKMHTTDASLDKAPQLFIQFIMSNS